MESVSLSVEQNWRDALLNRFAERRGAQREFAREIGCSESHLSLVLKDGRSVSYRLAKKISDATGISVDEIMNPLIPHEAAE